MNTIHKITLKIIIIILVNFSSVIFSQITANRFFYELTYKPSKDSSKIKKELMVLDITPEKSIYRDYSIISQDSIIKVIKEKAIRSGQTIDPQKMNFKMPDFTYKIEKKIPIKNIEFTDRILQDNFIYKEDIKLNWEIKPEKKKIGEYKTQKAICNYGGRKWEAWFSTDFPFQDGPYKFFGLPGLIIKINDYNNDYTWVLVGNKKVDNYNEKTRIEESTKNIIPISKEKYIKIYKDYKKDPFGSVRQTLKPEQLQHRMPNGKTFAENFKEEEEKVKRILNEINNPIELE
ncbi:GLPGLI family protein [Chryseobacterium candidae]|uniref:GLPGLI family protein n=2 Tax=Chryseobacterium candidae TaxID=1978493 RepID=A0ABY2R7L4_9FLAO|nr:GLPGLI family protein [Chryseobacterium candidae]